MKRLGAWTIFLGIALVGCTAGTEDSRSIDEPLGASTASITISPEAGGSCAQACFAVQSSKDIGFIALDTEGCTEAPVELSLYAIDGSGARARLAVTPEPHGNGKSCPDIPPAALKLDELSGKRLVVCASGAQSAEIFVKSGKTCTAQSFTIPAGGGQCQPDTPDWTKEMGALSFAARTDVAADPAGNVLYAGVGGVTQLSGAGEVRWSFPYGERVVSDAEGNAIVAGTFSTSIDLGFGALSPIGGSADVFVAKLDPSGNPVWAKSFGTSANESALSVAVDASGRIAVAIGALGTQVLAADGALLWSKPVAGALAFDASGNLAVTGEFSGVIDLGAGPVESGSGTDAFVVKLDPAGSFVWSHVLSDVVAGDQAGTSVAFDGAGNALIVGEVSGSIRLFGTDHVLPTSTESSNRGAYIAKLDPDGAALWAEVRLFTEDMTDVAVDAVGNVYVTGGDVGNVSPFRYNFVERRDLSGTLEWKLGSTTLEWPGLGFGHALALDACDNLFWSLWATEPPGIDSRSVLAKIDPSAI